MKSPNASQQQDQQYSYSHESVVFSQSNSLKTHLMFLPCDAMQSAVMPSAVRIFETDATIRNFRILI